METNMDKPIGGEGLKGQPEEETPTEEEILNGLSLEKGQWVKIGETFWDEDVRGKECKVRGISNLGNLVFEDKNGDYVTSLPKGDLTPKKIEEQISKLELPEPVAPWADLDWPADEIMGEEEDLGTPALKPELPEPELAPGADVDVGKGKKIKPGAWLEKEEEIEEKEEQNLLNKLGIKIGQRIKIQDEEGEAKGRIIIVRSISPDGNLTFDWEGEEETEFGTYEFKNSSEENLRGILVLEEQPEKTKISEPKLPEPESAPKTGEPKAETEDILDIEGWSGKEKKALKEIINFLPKDREKIGWGLNIIGFKVEKAKNDFFAAVFDLNSMPMSKINKKGTVGRFCRELQNSFRQDAKTAAKKAEDTASGKEKHRLSNVSLLFGNILKYGRIVADVTGASIANPFRYVMAGGMITARFSEAGKEARLKNEKVIEKTRIGKTFDSNYELSPEETMQREEDIELAAEEAWNIYKKAQQKEGKEGISAEALKNAYLMEMPEDIQNRLMKDPSAANTFIQKILKRQIGYSIDKLQRKIDDIIFNKKLNVADIEKTKEKLFKKWEKDLRDYDRIITQYGTVDKLAMTGLYLQKTSKAVVLGMQIETAFVSVEKLLKTVSNVLVSNYIHPIETTEKFVKHIFGTSEENAKFIKLKELVPSLKEHKEIIESGQKIFVDTYNSGNMSKIFPNGNYETYNSDGELTEEGIISEERAGILGIKLQPTTSPEPETPALSEPSAPVPSTPTEGETIQEALEGQEGAQQEETTKLTPEPLRNLKEIEIKKGGNIWNAGHSLIGEGQGKISAKQFNEAWSNPKSGAIINEKFVHIGKIGLTHENDNIVFVPRNGNEPAYFEVKDYEGDKYKIGAGIVKKLQKITNTPESEKELPVLGKDYGVKFDSGESPVLGKDYGIELNPGENVKEGLLQEPNKAYIGGDYEYEHPDHFPDLSHEENLIVENHPEFFAKNYFNLSGKELMQAYEASQKNIEYVFKNNPSVWNQLHTLKADKILKYPDEINSDPTIRRLSNYLNLLKKFTELEPESGFLRIGAENSEDYIARALQKLVADEKLKDFEEMLIE